ncbi:MAG: hypothetical protein AB8B93_05915 [Pseudomonadales bacterium]
MALQLDDLQMDQDLDSNAYRDICGGWAGFLSGLFAGSPGGGMPGMTNNFFVDYDVTHNIFQQNPVNLNVGAGDGSVVAIDSLNITPVSAGSPMTFVQGTPSV